VSVVVAVSRNETYAFSKPVREQIVLVAGLGVEGDAHAGTTVKHRGRIRSDPSQPNLRQVHLMHAELFDDMAERGHFIDPGQLGENVTTEGVDLIALSVGTRLRLGANAVVEVTGLRNPCVQIEKYRKGLLARVIGHDADGSVVRRAGVMSVVLAGGVVRAGDPIAVEVPAEHVPLTVV
jgi:MOSC domain-containing protein YiiM